MEINKIGNWTDEPCFYVSVMDGPKWALLLGPFKNEVDCSEWAYIDGGNADKHLKLIQLCHELDPKSAFYAFGMVKMQSGHRTGSLNGKLL